jgi:predicted nucleic acid-binding protein
LDKNYAFDTSAIFCYIEGEKGCDKVEHILTLAKKGKCYIYISFISLLEIYYISWQEKGEDIAKELVVMVKALPLQIVESNERLILSAGRIKARHRSSVADAIVAATAIEKSAVLVHKDPELEIAAQYGGKTLSLPYRSVITKGS